jgi:hypothetical protein
MFATKRNRPPNRSGSAVHADQPSGHAAVRMLKPDQRSHVSDAIRLVARASAAGIAAITGAPCRLGVVNQTLKEQRRRERLREYEAALSAAGSALTVLALFVRARESRARGESLEEAFAATSPGADGAESFPAAIWVALRQNDTEAALELLVSLSSTDFVIAAREQLDDGYRLVTVEEKRGLPELDRLLSQLSESLQVSVDVLAVVVGWGPEDPRTVSEIDALLEQRFGPPTASIAPLPPTTPRIEDPPPPRSATAAGSSGGSGGLTMSAGEFSALLNMSPDQRTVLATLIRQTTITINANE